MSEPARPLEEWHEDEGNALWWRFPVVEPPYVGCPLDEDWPGYHTHWTPIPIPDPPVPLAPERCSRCSARDCDCYRFELGPD